MFEDEDIIPKKKKRKFKKCKNCGFRIIEYPVYKGQEEGIPLMRGETKKEKFKSLFTPEARQRINWKNLIIGDWTKLLLLLTLIGVAFGYAYDTKECMAMIEHPCEIIMNNYQLCVNAEIAKQHREEGNIIDLEEVGLNFSIDK